MGMGVGSKKECESCCGVRMARTLDSLRGFNNHTDALNLSDWGNVGVTENEAGRSVDLGLEMGLRFWDGDAGSLLQWGSILL